MFTGLIEDTGQLKKRILADSAGKLVIATALPLAEIKVGDSIAVNGACLTVEQLDAGRSEVTFHTLRETLSRTNLGKLGIGGKVNLERAMRLGERIGGHLVLGHVDATAAVLSAGRKDNDLVLRISLPDSLQSLLIDKGSVAVDGISLTVVDLTEFDFTVHVIPHTWRNTALPETVPGQMVNLEADMIGKYVLRALRAGITGDKDIRMETLQQSGFLE